MSFFLTLAKLIKKPRALVIVGLGILLLLLFTLGAHWGINIFWRLIISAILAVIALLFVWLIGRVEKRRQAERIEQSLVLEAAASGPDDKSRKRQAREEMAAAIARLKASRLADGRSGKDALSVLPWYLVVGAPESGKSDLIARGGLPFPSGGADPMSACTPGSNCCWWFSNQAVLLEADGRFAVDSGQTAAADWDIFLDLLRKQQREPVLNGVLVTISADDLVNRDQAWLGERATLLRRRLDRIATNLDLLCPVYFVVTRCDLINGFQEFFGDLQGSARDQVWGATFSTNLMSSPVPGDLFQQEFDLLLQALERRRLPRLIRTEQDRTTQQQAFLFPLEFYKLRDKIRAFGEVLFAPSSYAHQPPWRGFYFATAGGSKGQPAETVLTDISQVIGLPGYGGYAPPSAPAPTQGPQREPRFLKTLFMNVLIPDQGLARLTARALRRRYSLRLAWRGIACLALPVLLVLSTVALVRNLQLGSESRRLAQDVRGVVAAGDQARDMAEALQQLEPLRLQLIKIDGWNGRRPLTVDMGLYEGQRMGAALRRIYFDRLREVLLQPSRERLEVELLSSYPSTREAFNRFFARYQVYRMLIQPEHGDPDLVTAELRTLWFGSAEMTEATIRQLELIDAHVDLAWRHLPDLREVASDLPRPRQNLVDRAEESIRRFWESDLYYENMITPINRDGRPFSTTIQSAFSGVLMGAPGSRPEDLVVPYAFTGSGWREHVLPRILGSEEELKNNWLLQEAFSDRTMDIRSELLAKYLGEHHRRWVAFLGAVDLVPSVRLGETHTRLRSLADRNSALFRFLEQARDTMDLGGQTRGLSESDVATFNRAVADFRSWHEFFRMQDQDDEAHEPAAVYVNLLDEMVQFLSQIIQEGDSLANAAEVGRQVFQADGKGGTALEAVFRQIPALVVEGGAASCDRALETFLRRPILMVWGACLRAAEEHIDTRWRDVVFSEFSARLNGFPMNPDAMMDVSVRDFAVFFRPGGTLDLFVNEQLGDFLIERTRRARIVLDGSLRLREQATAAIQQGDRLRDVLFAGGSSVPRAVFRIRPQQPVYVRGSGPAFTGTRLRFGEHSLLYDLGAPQNPEFTWSGDQFGLRASLNLLPDGVFPEFRIEASDWALFRLLNQAETNRMSETRFQLSWYIEDPQRGFRVRVPYELTANSAENPFSVGFFTFSCPSRLFP
jgi:type VI secretion system protein ImpL